MAFNSIAYAQFRLRGGVRGMLFACIAYFAALVIGIAIVYSSTEPSHRGEAFSALANGLVALQVLLYVMLGMQATSTAVEGDKNSNMIESHRLTPLSAGNAVLGYLGGAPCQAYALFLINCLLGVILYVLVPNIDLPLNEAVVINCVLFVFGLFLFSLIICWGLSGRKVARYVIGLIIIAWMSSGHIFSYLPGVSLLISPILWTNPTPPPDWVFAIGVGSQVAMGAILLSAAARKYRYPNLPAFTPRLGLILVGLMTLISAMGIHVWQSMMRNSYGWGSSSDALTQFSCSILLLAWLGMIPVLAAVRQPSRALNPPVVGILTALICGALLIVAPEGQWPTQLTIFSLVFLFELTMVYLLRFLDTWSAKAPMLAFGLLAIYAAGPFMADAFRFAAAPSGAARWTRLATLSPLGALVLIWNPNISLTLGIVFQTIVLIFVVTLFYFCRRRPRGAIGSTMPPPLPQATQLDGGNF